MKPIIKAQGLGKKYTIGATRQRYFSLRDRLKELFTLQRIRNKDFWAIQDLDFEIFPGESIGIIGKNGAGKSTLLKILSRITPPTKGNVLVRGRLASLLEVGTGFHPELTGRENIYLNGSILGLRRHEIDLHFDSIVNFSGVEPFLETPLKRYSSGMQLRLAFAVAAHLEPEILLIDEVLAVGDAEFQKKCIGKMDEVAKSGRTVLFVSHNLEVIKKLCKKSILLENGRISAMGETISTLSCYLDSVQFKNKSFNDPINVIYQSTIINISDIFINGGSNRHIDLNIGDSVEVVVHGYSEQETSLDIEVRVKDSKGNYFAFFVPTALRMPAFNLAKGKFTISRSFVFPLNMNQGEFSCDVYLTQHGFQSFAQIPDALHVNFSGTPLPNGNIFRQSAGAGYLFLEANENTPDKQSNKKYRN